LKRRLALIMLILVTLCNLAAMRSSLNRAQAQPTTELYVNPSTYTAQRTGETFNVTVNIRNLQASQNLVFAGFRVRYNDTLLQPIGEYEGPFLQQFNNTAHPPYTTFITFVDNNQTDPVYGPDVIVGILVVPASSPNGGIWTNYPYGDGTLATITFESIYQPVEPFPTASSLLNLTDTLLVGAPPNEMDVTDIPHTATSATYYAQQIAPTITYEPVEPSAGEVTIFKVDEPETASLNYSWNFGDGIVKNTTSPTVIHAFPNGGEYDVTLIVDMNGVEATASETVTVGSYMPLGIITDVGSLHFRGETAEFTILTTDAGKRVNITSLQAGLYFNGALIEDLTDTNETVDTGFYIIPYSVPADAQPGEYTLLVEAQYYEAYGTSMAKFTVSPTLTTWNDSIAQIIEIQNGVATVSNGITNLTLNMTAINATITSLVENNGQVLAKIDTTAGTLTTQLSTINATITAVQGNTVTITSTLGTIQTKLDGIQNTANGIQTTANGIQNNANGIQTTATTTLYATSILSAIAVVLALAILALMMRKK
jgi:hypothetical protein